MDTFLCQQRQRFRVARVNPQRRVGFLYWTHGQRHVLILMNRPGEIECSMIRQGLLDESHSLMRERPAIMKIGAVGAEEVGNDACDQTKIETTVQ